MFEDFSFSSSSSNGPLSLAYDADGRILDCDCAMVSPLSSRCSSPSPIHRQLPKSHLGPRPSCFRCRQPPTSIPTSCEYPRHLSVGALTQKLYAHTLRNGSGSGDTDNVPSTPDSPLTASAEVAAIAARDAQWPLTPSDTDHDDERYCELSPLNPTIRWRPDSPFSITSAPPQTTNTTTGPPLADVDYTLERRNIRLQRQQLSRLQCDAEIGPEAPWLALLAQERSEFLDKDALPLDEDDRHPSCLPPEHSSKLKSSGLHHAGFWEESPCSAYEDELSPRQGTRKKSSPGCLSPSSCYSHQHHSHSHHHNQYSHRIEKPRHQRSSRCDLSTSRDPRRKSDHGLRRKSLVSLTLAKMALDSSDPSWDPISGTDSDPEST